MKPSTAPRPPARAASSRYTGPRAARSIDAGCPYWWRPGLASLRGSPSAVPCAYSAPREAPNESAIDMRVLVVLAGEQVELDVPAVEVDPTLPTQTEM